MGAHGTTLAPVVGIRATSNGPDVSRDTTKARGTPHYTVRASRHAHRGGGEGGRGGYLIGLEME